MRFCVPSSPANEATWRRWCAAWTTLSTTRSLPLTRFMCSSKVTMAMGQFFRNSTRGPFKTKLQAFWFAKVTSCPKSFILNDPNWITPSSTRSHWTNGTPRSSSELHRRTTTWCPTPAAPPTAWRPLSTCSWRWCPKLMGGYGRLIPWERHV